MSRSTSSCFDVLGLGCTAVDDVIYVPSFPGADEKLRVERSIRRFGGLTGAALVTAARLGVRCAYAGRLGTDDASQQISENFVRERVDVQHAPRSAENRVVSSVIIVGQDRGTRNVFFRNDGRIGADDWLPAASVIQASKVLLIDDYGRSGNLRAVRIARSAGVAVVGDFENPSAPGLKELLDQIDHLIVSLTFASSFTGKRDPAAAALAFWRPDRAVVIVTCGQQGCYSVETADPSQARRHQAFQVNTVDTTGCGDVFHGAYAASLARGQPVDQRIASAAAAAALKARDSEIPRRAALERFLREHPVSRARAKTRGVSPKQRTHR